MLVFAAYTPHTPLMLPGVGKEQREELSETVSAMEKLREELYAARPDALVLISAHANRHDDAFGINLHDEYEADAEDFGDHATRAEFFPDLALIDAIQRSARRAGIPLTLDSDRKLDHGAAVPLLALSNGIEKLKIVPLSHSGLPPRAHADFGRALKEILSASPKRVAVIASGDLSHALSPKAPAGLRREGRIFDERVRAAVEGASLSKLLALDAETVRAAEQCAYEPLLTLLGVLERVNVTPEILAYEAPFGVGYLTVQFHLA